MRKCRPGAPTAPWAGGLAAAHAGRLTLRGGLGTLHAGLGTLRGGLGTLRGGLGTAHASAHASVHARPHVVALVLATLLAALPGLASAASFDCARAGSKLTRAICADADLSRLDEQVWDAYGERISTLTGAQYEQVRDRHITWRRQRGRFDRSIAGLTTDYRSHLAWLTHPLLPLEGRYQRADGAEVNVEIDMRSSAPALIAFGRSSTLQWLPERAGVRGNPLQAELAAGTPQPSAPWRDNALRVTPGFVGAPSMPIASCAFTLRWSAGVPVARPGMEAAQAPAAAKAAITATDKDTSTVAPVAPVAAGRPAIASSSSPSATIARANTAPADTAPATAAPATPPTTTVTSTATTSTTPTAATPVTSLSQFGDTLVLESTGSCGADFAGSYQLQGPAQPWPRHPYRTPGAAVVNPSVPSLPGPGNAGPGHAESNNPGPGNAGPGNNRPIAPGPDKTGPTRNKP